MIISTPKQKCGAASGGSPFLMNQLKFLSTYLRIICSTLYLYRHLTTENERQSSVLSRDASAHAFLLMNDSDAKLWFACAIQNMFSMLPNYSVTCNSN